MKKLGKIKLNQLSKAEMEKRELSKLMGGENCECGCAGPSSTYWNSTTNDDYGYSDSYGEPNFCGCDTMLYVDVLA